MGKCSDKMLCQEIFLSIFYPHTQSKLIGNEKFCRNNFSPPSKKIFTFPKNVKFALFDFYAMFLKFVPLKKQLYDMSNAQNQSPRIVKSHDIHIDNDYAEWITELKQRYRSVQVKAAVRVNAGKLIFNWQLGRDLVQKKAEERWGVGVVEQVSLDLKREFPNSDGFSERNLWYMKQWYLFYTKGDSNFLHQVGAELQLLENKNVAKLHQLGGEFYGENLQQDFGEFPMPFALVPWRHHVEIITKCDTVEKALFYIGKTIEQGLSRAALVNCLKANLYEHQGKITNNFSDHLPDIQSKLVQEVFKENYDFGFATVSHEIYDEKEIVVGGRTRKIDLLFYHIKLRCYIVCELKAKPFEPEFTGKLNYYVNAVDELLKTDDDNPTIGLLICSDINKTDVQWSFRGISTPMGVATYNNKNLHFS